MNNRSIPKKDCQGFILKYNSIYKNGFRKKAFLMIFITLMGIIILFSQVFGFVLINNHIKYICNIIYALKKILEISNIKNILNPLKCYLLSQIINFILK